jgi:hypothetical protein
VSRDCVILRVTIHGEYRENPWENARFWQKNDEKRQGKIQIKKIKKFTENVEKKLDK